MKLQHLNLGKPRVLIADDEDNYRLLLTLILESQGWKVSQARNGREALEKVLEGQPDLLILDYQMPGLTGAEVYQNLQLHGINLPVLLISSYLEVDELASSLGIEYSLNKPFELTKFLETVQSAYEHSSQES